ncbi:MAG: response regulator [Bacteriovorax sp.]|nr:response regulator [Bacteriovorax sp.]
MEISSGTNFKILIADENIIFRNNLATSLRLQRFVVEYVTGGFHLMHVLEKDRDCSLIIIHEDMHDMPAAEIILLVRTIFKKPELPILFISKYNDEERICDMIFNGANEYIVKTDNFQAIVERAKKYLAISKNS